ncbi:hypothetical protein Drorol1_Dr00011603 [Drosera rotundifolia]
MVGMRNASSLSPESHCGRFTDLKDLNGLRGQLCIKILGRLGAEQRQSDAANLRGKRGLLKLHVKFDDDNSEDDEAIMEGLQPHPDLKELVIENYGGLRLPSSMALPNLVDIRLYSCSRCQHLPSFAQLASLRRLVLWGCPGVEYMESSIGYKSAASPSQSSASVMPSFFPSLEHLRLINMPNMKGWWKGEERGEGQGSEIVDQPWQLDATNSQPLLPFFPKLSHLEIGSCPNLTCSPAPLSPYVEELQLREVDEKMVSMLKGQMATTVADHENTSFSSLSPSFSTLPVSNLKTLTIIDLTTLESFPRDCFKGLLSLQSFGIFRLARLRSLSGLEHLTGLRGLTIWFCKELDLFDDEMMPWEALKSLRDLTLRGIPKMSSVPAGFQHLTALESLCIEECGELGALPEWVTSLPSLQRIEMDKRYIRRHGSPLLRKGSTTNAVAREKP